MRPQDPKLADGKGGVAKEKETTDEVGGRGYRVLYTCCRCGAGNWVDSDWSFFICWSDGALCYMV